MRIITLQKVLQLDDIGQFLTGFSNNALTLIDLSVYNNIQKVI